METSRLFKLLIHFSVVFQDGALVGAGLGCDSPMVLRCHAQPLLHLLQHRYVALALEKSVANAGTLLLSDNARQTLSQPVESVTETMMDMTMYMMTMTTRATTTTMMTMMMTMMTMIMMTMMIMTMMTTMIIMIMMTLMMMMMMTMMLTMMTTRTMMMMMMTMTTMMMIMTMTMTMMTTTMMIMTTTTTGCRPSPRLGGRFPQVQLEETLPDERQHRVRHVSHQGLLRHAVNGQARHGRRPRKLQLPANFLQGQVISFAIWV